MNLRINNNHITGYIDYFKHSCSGSINGKVTSNGKLKLSENITENSEICDNANHLYDLKYQIISKADSYMLEGDTHNIIITQYGFTPKSNVWNNVSLNLEIEQLKKSIQELNNTIARPMDLIAQAKEKSDKAQYTLDHNHTAYVDGKCIKLPLATPKPDPFYDTKEKAKHSALAYCSISFGCRVGVELARNKLDTGAKRFLASQSCTLMVRNYQEKGTLLDETMFNLLDAVSYAGCNDDSSSGIFSGLVQGGSCIMSTATRLARVGQYMGCIDYKTQEFHNSYLNWKNAPEKKQNECEKDLKIVNDTPKIVAKYHEEINIIKNNIAIKYSELERLNDKLKDVLSLREKQSEFIKLLTR